MFLYEMGEDEDDVLEVLLCVHLLHYVRDVGHEMQVAPVEFLQLLYLVVQHLDLKMSGLGVVALIDLPFPPARVTTNPQGDEDEQYDRRHRCEHEDMLHRETGRLYRRKP